MNQQTQLQWEIHECVLKEILVNGIETIQMPRNMHKVPCNYNCKYRSWLLYSRFDEVTNWSQLEGTEPWCAVRFLLAVPGLRPLVGGFPSWRTGFDPMSMWDLWWTKWHWESFSPNTSVSPTNSRSIDRSTLIIIIIPHPETYNRQVSPHPKKKIRVLSVTEKDRIWWL
jgi:hypothetical protein